MYVSIVTIVGYLNQIVDFSVIFYLCINKLKLLFLTLSTPGERELVEFLTEEIVAERKAQKVKSLPTELQGFVVKGDGAEVTLTKKLNDES